MVARRLMIVMLVMLVIASVSSVFLGDPGGRDGPTTATRTTTEPAGAARQPAGEGRLVSATLDASASSPETIRLRVGDQLALRVEARRAGQVDLTAFGQLEDIDPPAPARFNLTMDRAGSFPVRLLTPKRTIGVLVVKRAAPKAKPRRSG